MRFQVGDRVKVISDMNGHRGETGTVDRMPSSEAPVVLLDSGTRFAVRLNWIQPLTEIESTTLSEEELEILEAAKDANPWFFEALKEEAGIMPARREDYSPNADPHENFRVAADILKSYWKFTQAGIDIDGEDVAVMYIALKIARFLTGGDTDYQGAADSGRDAGNYLKLWRGMRIQAEDGNDA